MQGRTEVSMNLLGVGLGKSGGHGTNSSQPPHAGGFQEETFFLLVQILREQSQNSLTLLVATVRTVPNRREM